MSFDKTCSRHVDCPYLICPGPDCGAYLEIVEKTDKAGKKSQSKQSQLAEKSGTPEQFEKAIWKAYSYLVISNEEAIAAIKKYRAEWDEAGR